MFGIGSTELLVILVVALLVLGPKNLPKIAQSQPGFKVRFIQVSLELAQSLYLRELNKMKTLDKALNG